MNYRRCAFFFLFFGFYVAYGLTHGRVYIIFISLFPHFVLHHSCFKSVIMNTYKVFFIRIHVINVGIVLFVLFTHAFFFFLVLHTYGKSHKFNKLCFLSI